ncbi:MAG: heme ABC exporter ATP-binding protein CcmA [Gammaproteobacteria bacterium]|nr:heme ABC exporter ATP-binding protein CcmA [Gammaproteobacteria bacterium]MCZ6853178.1 heme ABC exporter ATP-binding protein CcmA [Gammaproteobacteria bacterium]
MSDSLLTTVDLRCERDGRTLFADLQIKLGRGECLVVVGPNGSGKSTLLRCVAGLFPDYEGAVEITRALYLGHKLGINLLLTARENLHWYEGLTGQASLVSEVLERVGMAGYEHVVCQRLSAGQQRRVGLARLLICNASMWLLDEPLTALDEAGQGLVTGLISDHLATGGGVFCATHQPLAVAVTQTLELGGRQ